MSRCGYSDYDDSGYDFAMWRGQVASAIRRLRDKLMTQLNELGVYDEAHAWRPE